jgi:PAS domain S-box-containing protein
MTTDVGDRKRVERLLMAEQTISSLVTSGGPLDTTIASVLEVIGITLGWTVGEIWLEDDPGLLTLASTWRRSRADLEAFTRSARHRTFPTNRGLFGKIYRTRRPHWISDLAVAPRRLHRGPLGVQGSLHAVVGLPVTAGDQPFGVLLFFDEGVRDTDSETAEALTSSSRQLGQFIERRRAEATTVGYADLLQTMLDNVPVMLRLSDADGTARYFNRELERKLGWTLAETSKIDYFQELYPDQAERARVELQVREAAGWAASSPRTRSGTVISTDWCTVALPDGRRLSIGVDTTERIGASESLARLAAIVEYSNEAIIGKDLEGVITSWNAAAEALFGHPAKEIIGLPVTVLYPPDRLGEFDEVMARIRLGQAVEPFETVRLRKGGTPVEISLSVSPIRDRGGTVVGGSTIGHDITEKRRSERALRSSEERFQALLRNTPAIVYLKDADGRYVFVNLRAEERLGLPERDIVGKTHDELFPDDEPHDDTDTRDREVLDSGAPLEFEERDRIDGKERVYLSIRFPLTDVDGRRLVCGISTDITERKRAEEALLVRSEQQASLIDLGRKAIDATEIDSFLVDGCALMADSLHVDQVALLELSPDRQELIFREGSGWPGGTVGTRMSVHVMTLAGYVLATGAAATSSDFETETRFSLHPTALRAGARSGMSVAIPAGDVPNGVLVAYSKGRRVFRADDIAYLQSAGDLIGLTLQRARVERDLRETLDVLRTTDMERRRLVSQLVGAQEEERARIAGDIHDDSIQVMTAALMRLATLRRKLDEGALRDAAQDLESTLIASIERLRHLMFELRPPSLDRDGLAAALREQLAEMAGETGIAYRVDNLMHREVPSDLRVIMYRIAQEALHNVRKHAQAGHVTVTIEEEGGGVQLRIVDDGRGFDERDLSSTGAGHLGLTSMRERAEMVGGRCNLYTSPGRGTRVEAWVPIRVEEAVPS